MAQRISQLTQSRLNQLPGRVQKTLQGLIDVGHIDEPTLSTVLDAGELSSDTSRLSAFATSYLFLRQKSVPVGDVINLAKQHHRKISLWWSATRWQTEHQRLSRLATLTALSEENITYNVKKFTERLPQQFAGYLIKGSRRLGMEGLRQQHCVASWHRKLESGYCAIAVVFHNKTRWTVELFETGNSNFPLRIGQIKKKLNGMPNANEERSIYDILQIKRDVALTSHYSNSETHWCYRDNLRRLIPIFEEIGIESIECEFAGYGDSGQIESIDIEPDTAKDRIVTIIQRLRSYDNGVWITRNEEQAVTLHDAIENIVYDYLESTGIDWYNNEGGQGRFEIDVEKESLRFYVDVNEVTSETAHSDELEFAELMN